VEIDGKKIRTSPLSSLTKARTIADELTGWIKKGEFFLQEPVGFQKREALLFLFFESRAGRKYPALPFAVL
ncbi:homocysteine biosynthesis protein, partial [Eubacterium callanderi]|uniref:homocysteine biosynthesis protein n=1 Tax=Eubacterium callanderi TaxID=53442 RepID=UPI0021091F8A